MLVIVTKTYIHTYVCVCVYIYIYIYIYIHTYIHTCDKLASVGEEDVSLWTVSSPLC